MLHIQLKRTHFRIECFPRGPLASKMAIFTFHSCLMVFEIAFHLSFSLSRRGKDERRRRRVEIDTNFGEGLTDKSESEEAFVIDIF